MTAKEIEERKAAALEDQALQLEWQNALIVEFIIQFEHFKWAMAYDEYDDSGLIEGRERVLNRAELIRAIWDLDYEGGDDER